MKKIILSLSILLASAAVINAQTVEGATPIQNENAAVLSFEEEVVDYGTIEQGADGVREFVFTNTGKSPLIISNAVGSCGCTVPTWPKEPIKPGQKAAIKVKYDTKRIGAINKSVTITSNATEPTKIIRIKGTVVAPKTTPTKEAVGAPAN